MTVTTQLTSKSLKLQTILSSLIFWIGFTFFAVGVNSTTNPGEGATIGGRADLRGLSEHRYLGDASAYAGAEVRTHLFRSSVFLPLKFGGITFMDVGRVFLDGEDSDTWRKAYGVGLWISPDVSEYGELDDMRLLLSVGRSGGEHALYISTRFAF